MSGEKKQRAGIPFGLFAKICFVGALVMLGINLAPAAKCAASGMDDAEIQTEEEAEAAAESASTSDVTRVSNTTGFFGRFFGSIGTCMSTHPITNNVDWKKYGLAGSGGGFVLFLLLSMAFKPRFKAG